MQFQSHCVITYCGYNMQLRNVPCPLIGQQLTSCLVIKEMFRDRIAEWASLLDLITCKISTVVVMTRVRPGLLPSRNYRSTVSVIHINSDPRREMAYAYAQLSRVNR
jgi:hypothetical protein